MVTNEEPAISRSNAGVLPTAQRRILLVGVDPTLVDFRTMPDLDAARVRAASAANHAGLTALGFTVETCVIDLGATAEAVLKEALSSGDFDCVMIGAGVRVVPENVLLFERVINVVHRHAPRAAICFNTSPGDTVETARRSLAAWANR
ncbi:hypothetical protein [Streptomyces sp. RFCAC02]|uniref:hypothetical protein n=1 Tax=Streptomyces sp. RFCAC02 TaxID=2499143 RepID=UPI0010221F9D|nr:hypothetical protein [Streptomyces sp. RFCAC02]